ncbi:amidohydrolase [Vibrio hippocampi]|uniref:Indole-3-acetyl-aspartic acid hydrolase n=1 Tax=Vibrio hippocampi TaxID=654686 RepID=A0ABM8ZNM6_9VIBR|nr:amidohydrolase [Vibrio hippocampi]CAH0529862.1 Indole-3-acetyl-aspartic acid hydrolase [Vibrio hippocampi]
MNKIVPLKKDNTGSNHEAIRLRRHFHQNPETGFTEFWTTSEICDYLSELGYEIHYGKDLYRSTYPSIQHISEVAQIDKNKVDSAYQTAKASLPESPWLAEMEGGFTGVIAILDCVEKGPITGFRFDIDGLPVQESSGSEHIPSREQFASRNNNMHACGHDGHTAIGLALAKQIADNRNQLSGRFVLVFQPSEEGPSGGEVFARFDIFKQLDYLVPLHIGIIDERKIVCGLSFLNVRNCRVIFRGKNAHAAVSPELGRNALQAACTAVTNLYGISRHREGMSRLNVGQMCSNNPTNIISDHAEFELEVRGEQNKISHYLFERANSIIRGAAAMYDVEVEIEELGEYVCADNSEKSVSLMKKAAINIGLDQDVIVERKLTSASEDATFLMNAVNENNGSASYLCLGSPTYGGHHHPSFDFDEDMLVYGVDILFEYIRCSQPSHNNSLSHQAKTA